MRIVMTGATAGIGLEAAKRLRGEADGTLVVGARTPAKLPAALAGAVDARLFDLASLTSVRAFASGVLREAPLDALVLNAGLQCSSPRHSQDGFELTFAVNHLAHYLLARMLAAHIKLGGRIVLTASGVHDPALASGVPPPHHANAKALAFPELDQDLDKSAMTAGMRAYATSKLCNVMTARELARCLASDRPDLAVMAFDPGLTPGTRLARHHFEPIGAIFKHVLPLVMRKGPGVSTPENSGRLLADLVLSPDYGAARGDYFAVRGEALERRDPSVLARDDAACAKLWDDSAELVGLPAD